jgi:hypothetical protein
MFTRRMIAVVVTSLAALTVAGGAEAAAPGKKGVNAQAIQQLRAARALLHRANHDYKGHRVKAIQEINHALHALGVAKPRAAGPKGLGKEAQEVSDAQLRKAEQQLQSILSLLGSAPAGQGRARATGHVKKAIRELETALNIA